MIRELFDKKENYFWSTSIEEPYNIRVGGYSAGKFYGQVDFITSEEALIIKIQTGNGYPNTHVHSPLEYSSLTEQYKEFVNLDKEIRAYIDSHDTKSYQNLNRKQLMINLMEYLPKY